MTNAGSTWQLSLVATNALTGAIEWSGWGVSPPFHDENTYFVATKYVGASSDYICLEIANHGNERMVYRLAARPTG